MSGAALRRFPAGRRRGLARVWLLAFAVITVAAGCLITSTPQFTVQAHTPPFLLEAMANPIPGEIWTIDLAGQPSEQQFSAFVVSQDDPTGAFSEIRSRLTVYFGTPLAPPSYPWIDDFHGTPLTQPGTLDMQRPIEVKWRFDPTSLQHGCYAVVLTAAHNFDEETDCPCVGDFSQIYWQVWVCNTADNDCDELAVASCPVLTTNNCTEYTKFLEDGGQFCPASGTGGSSQ
jgi:hypothetical protein